VIAHPSGDFNDKNIQNHRLNTVKGYIITVAENLKKKKKRNLKKNALGL